MVRLKEGVFYKENKPYMIISADYPYYRDSPENWVDRIETLKEAGIEVVTFYVPWRHHHLLYDGEYIVDFLGETQGNRNVIKFIELIHSKGMYAIVKPGPFIHAETDFGGLPDFVAGEVLGETMLDHQNQARTWHKKLPAPFDARFDEMVKEWYRKVDATLIDPFTYPNGPVIALQILNEGLYSDGQNSVLDYDYSSSGIDYHQKRLEEVYGSIEEYNQLFGTDNKSYKEVIVPRGYDLDKLIDNKEIIGYLHWGESQNRYLGELYERWGNQINTSLPILNNINPPWPQRKGFDFWLTRVVPEHWNISYGFTNWIGVVSHNESAFLRYLLLVKRDRGMNLEENWGFSKLYDQRYRFHHIPYYQTVLAMGLGATGFNVYTGISTDQWTDELDSVHERPYPDCSPISEKGETGEKYEALKILVSYLKQNEKLLLEGKRENDATWALYPPYSYLASFSQEDKDIGVHDVSIPNSGHKGLESFMLTMLNDQREFGMLNIETATIEELQKEKVLVMLGGSFLARHVQDKLIAYAQEGGTLYFFGEIPKYDDTMHPYQGLSSVITIKDRFHQHKVGNGTIIYYPENPFISGGISQSFSHLLENEIGESLINAKNAYTFLFEKDGEKAIYVLSHSQFQDRHDIEIQGETLSVDLPAKGCAIITLRERSVTSCVVKGINDYDESFVKPYIQYGESVVEASEPCDFYFEESSNSIKQVNVRNRNRVSI